MDQFTPDFATCIVLNTWKFDQAFTRDTFDFSLKYCQCLATSSMCLLGHLKIHPQLAPSKKPFLPYHFITEQGSLVDHM